MRKRTAPWPKWLFDRLGPDFLGAVTQVQVGAKDPDAVMGRVGDLGRLEILNFSFNVPVSDAGLKSVRKLTALKMIGVPIRGGQLTGACLENLKDLTGLREILLTSSPVLTDADLVHLKGLTGLQHLQLSTSAKNEITDAGLANFENMVDMRTLNIRGQMTSAGLNHLRKMVRLHELWMPATRVEDLSPIRNLTGLKFLQLASTPITDAGLAPVAGFVSLERLFLQDTRITDAGLIHLRGLKSLIALELSKTRITDAGLAELAELTSLQVLSLNSTSVTDAGVCAPRKARVAVAIKPLRHERHRRGIEAPGRSEVVEPSHRRGQQDHASGGCVAPDRIAATAGREPTAVVPPAPARSGGDKNSEPRGTETLIVDG